MSIRAEFRRELERACTAIDKVNIHLQKAGAYAIEGKRPELDEALMTVGLLLVSVKDTVNDVHDSL